MAAIATSTSAPAIIVALEEAFVFWGECRAMRCRYRQGTGAFEGLPAGDLRGQAES